LDIPARRLHLWVDDILAARQHKAVMASGLKLPRTSKDNHAADVIGNAVHVMKVLTGEPDEDPPVDDGKGPAAKALGAKGAARAKAVSPEPKRSRGRRPPKDGPRNSSGDIFLDFHRLETVAHIDADPIREGMHAVRTGLISGMTEKERVIRLTSLDLLEMAMQRFGNPASVLGDLSLAKQLADRIARRGENI
jgi:hypothetical protein